jgi:hypothetical protein
LTNGNLYAFWVSPAPSGASFGYVSGGGPGFTGHIDSTSVPVAIRTPDQKNTFTFSIQGHKYLFDNPAKAIKIYSLNGKLIHELRAVNNSVRWNGIDKEGRGVTPGVYIARGGVKSCKFVVKK